MAAGWHATDACLFFLDSVTHSSCPNSYTIETRYSNHLGVGRELSKETEPLTRNDTFFSLPAVSCGYLHVSVTTTLVVAARGKAGFHEHFRETVPLISAS